MPAIPVLAPYNSGVAFADSWQFLFHPLVIEKRNHRDVVQDSNSDLSRHVQMKRWHGVEAYRRNHSSQRHPSMPGNCKSLGRSPLPDEPFGRKHLASALISFSKSEFLLSAWAINSKVASLALNQVFVCPTSNYT